MAWKAEGYVFNKAGTPQVGTTVNAYPISTVDGSKGALAATTTTAAATAGPPERGAGYWSISGLDESKEYIIEIIYSASQKIVRTRFSAEMGTLYVKNTLTTAAGATVAFGGAISAAGQLTVSTGGANITGAISHTGAITTSGVLTVNNTANIAGGAAVTGVITATTTITAGTGLRATTGGLIVTAGGATITGNSGVVGNLSVGASVAAAGNLHVKASATGTSPVVIEGAASQSAALLSAINSSAVTVASISPAGLVFGKGGGQFDGNVAITGQIRTNQTVDEGAGTNAWGASPASAAKRVSLYNIAGSLLGYIPLYS